MTTAPAPDLDYGGWRTARGAEYLGSTPAQVTLSATLLAGIAALQISLLALGVVIGCGLLVLCFTGFRIGDATAAGHLWRRWTFSQAKAKGWLSFHAATGDPDHWSKPGVLERTTMVDVVDGRGERWGMLRTRKGTLTATLSLAATTTHLHEVETAENWVKSWHVALARLGSMPGLDWISVTIETTPATETGLQDSLLRSIDPKAPASCRALLTELAAMSPQSSPHVATWLTAHFTPGKASETKRADTATSALHLSRLLDVIADDVAKCGVTVLGPMTAPHLSATVRAAFDPGLREDLERSLHGDHGDPFELVRWGDAGPMSARAEWDHYVHDGYASKSFGWRGAPTGRTLATALDSLAAPGEYPRRVTLIYRPMSSEKASKYLDQQVNAARDRHRRARAFYRREPTYREQVDLAVAEKSALEEALGAGVVNVSLYVTTTVSDPADLDAAQAEVIRRCPAKIALRPLDGAHDVGFLATLPVGVHPSFLVKEKNS